MADPSMDEFAQTRGADDLFDDEIIPVSAEEQQVQTEVVEPEVEPIPQEDFPRVEKPASPRGETPQKSRGGERGRGRGRGRGKGGRGGRESQSADQKRAESAPRKIENAPRKNGTSKSGLEGSRWATAEESPEKPQEAEKEKDQPTQEDESKSEAASNADVTDQSRVPAVRGDRSATGGVRKPKLTEEELSKRIAAAKENAVKKAAAHARAQADQASFIEREQIAAKKRREELANRRVMDNEREQNRQRKLKAQTGREWDSQKREEDYNPRGGGSQFRRGMHGGVSGPTRRDFDAATEDHGANDLLSPGRGRGHGGRGGRGGRRGPSRGPKGERATSREPSEKGASPAVNTEDFPALPAGKKPDDESKPAIAPTSLEKPSMEKLEATMSPVTGTWADQFDDE